MKEKKKYYAYTVGGDEGIVDSWDVCKEKVHSTTGAKYKGFKTRKEAEDWLKAGAHYEKKAANRHAEKQELDDDSIYFDSGTGRGDGVEISVTFKDGTPLLWKVVPHSRLTERGTVYLDKGRTNNFGELAALYSAIVAAQKLKKKVVCGDSKLVIDFWSKGHVSKKKKEDTELLKLVEQIVPLRKQFEKEGGVIKHIKGGINPADLGFHRD
jgi:ribonuclease H-related protein